MPFEFKSTYDPTFTTQAAALLGARARAAARVADVTGQANAQADLAAGQARANMAAGIGTAAGDLLRLPATLKTQRIEQAKLQIADDDAQDEMAIRQAEQQHGGDATKVQTALEKTRPTAATKYQTRVRAQHLQALQENKFQTDAAMDSITKISQVLSGVNDVPADQRAAAYQAALPTILRLLPPDGHGDVPKEFDQTYVDTAIAEGRTAKERLELLQASNHALELANTQAKDKREAEKFYTEAVARRYQTADNQEELDAIIADSKAHGVPDAVLNQFPTTFSAKAKEKAALFLPSADRVKSSYEQKTVTLDGKPNQLVNYNPQTGQSFLPGSVEPIAATRIAGNPAASIQIHNMGSTGQNWAGDWDKTGAEFLSSVPAQWRKTVEKIAQYDEDPTKVASMRGDNRAMVMAWVNQVNPAYDSSMFTNRAPTRKAYTTGTQGQQINAMNTAIGHIDQLQDVAAALANGSFVPGNRLWNSVKTTFGQNAPTNFDTLKDALAGEVASVLSKGQGTVSGIADAKEKINSANSPEQLAGYVKTLIPIMGSKLNELNFQYHQAMGEDDPFQALSPASMTALQKYGFDPKNPTIAGGAGASTGITVTSPSGKPFTFKTQAEADTAIAAAKAAGLWK